mmetsp:Transcript_10258/g.17207  ORF Transcript_10258/g.17207 Transcript_10258/m.17207 type:complete len:85 (+) Transcript_10258:130-384(+)
MPYRDDLTAGVSENESSPRVFLLDTMAFVVSLLLRFKALKSLNLLYIYYIYNKISMRRNKKRLIVRLLYKHSSGRKMKQKTANK